MAWVDIPDLGQGLNLDGQPEELALGVASAGRNIRYRTGAAERFHGMQTVFTTPTIAPYGIAHFTVGGLRYVVYAGLQKTFADDGSTQTEITNASNTGAQDDRWCQNVFNGIYIQNNGVDVPQYWDGNVANNLVNFTAWPGGYKAGFIRPYKNYLVAGDITRGGVRERGTILWSTVADPGTMPTSWDITDATKDAGDEPLAETNGTLIDLLPLGDMGVIYKDDALHFMQLTGTSAIFRFGRLPGDTGLIARGCVTNTPQGHVYLAPNLDLLMHNGQGPQSILDGRARKWLAANINTANPQRSFLVHYAPAHEVVLGFPVGADATCSLALVWNYKDNTYSVRDLPTGTTYGSVGQVNINTGTSWGSITTTWATETRAWGDLSNLTSAPKLIFSRTTPALAMYDSTEQDVGASFTATYERTGIHLDKPQAMKLIRGLRPKIDAAAGTNICIQVGSSMVPDVYPTWSNPVEFVVGTDIEVNVFSTSGRFLAMRMYTTADTPWRVRSCQMDVVEMGAY